MDSASPVQLQWDLAAPGLLSMRAVPLIDVPWRTDQTTLDALNRLNEDLEYGHVEYEPDLGMLMYRAVVNLDWAPLDDELLGFLLDAAVAVTPLLVHPSERSP